jgi:hypothetical protein
LQAFFQNRKEIFPDTDIFNNTAISWQSYPVMYFDMSVLSPDTALQNELTRFKKEQGITETLEECMFVPNPRLPSPPLVVPQFREVLCTYDSNSEAA